MAGLQAHGAKHYDVQLPAQEKARELMRALQKGKKGDRAALARESSPAPAPMPSRPISTRWPDQARQDRRAAPGHSNHVACGYRAVPERDYLEESPWYKVAGEIGKGLGGLERGGDWSTSWTSRTISYPRSSTSPDCAKTYESGTAFVSRSPYPRTRSLSSRPIRP